MRNCSRHVSAASADADSQHRHACEASVAVQASRGSLNVGNLCCGILELARSPGTLAEIAVIKREGDESALGKGAAPGSGCLFFHTRRVRSGSRRRARHLAGGEGSQPGDRPRCQTHSAPSDRLRLRASLPVHRVEPIIKSIAYMGGISLVNIKTFDLNLLRALHALLRLQRVRSGTTIEPLTACDQRRPLAPEALLSDVLLVRDGNPHVAIAAGRASASACAARHD